MWDDYAGLPPFRRGQAGDHGLRDADVRRLLRQGVLVRVAHGLLCGYRRPELAADEPEQVAIRVQAMQRRYPLGIAAYRTGAALNRMWLIGHSGPVHLIRSHGYPREKHDVLVETAAVPENHRCVAAGVVTTTIARTAVDLAARLAANEALALVDSALRAGASSCELLDIARWLGNEPDSKLCRLLERADPRSQSPLESMSRWLFHASRIPDPDLQVLIGDDEGPFALVDFLWREHGVIGEADGMTKYDGADALRQEKMRQERLERMGFLVLRWTFDDIVMKPWATVARIRGALGRPSSCRPGAA
jgi:hypothetical protein